MWAGGSFEWDHSSPLTLGTTITQHSRIAKAERKKDMLFVHQERLFYAADNEKWGVKEIRTHVFRQEVVEGNKAIQARALAGTSLLYCCTPQIDPRREGQ
jgi:hydroxyacyl-ACP dehydratase HTD2-like protein with hotdog domain